MKRETRSGIDVEPNSHEFNPKTLTIINNEVLEVIRIISFTELQRFPRRAAHAY